MEMEKYIEKGLMAFVPVYLDMKGNSTILYTFSSGKIEVYKSIRTFLNGLGKYFLLDLKQSNKYYGELLGSNNGVPIPFNKDNIFIPVKVRRPISKNDGSLGYINIKYIEKVVEEDGQGIVYLKFNIKIKSLNTTKTIEKHIREGHIVGKFYEEKHGTIYEIDDFYSQSDKPATKGDIALLRQEILSIRETLH